MRKDVDFKFQSPLGPLSDRTVSLSRLGSLKPYKGHLISFSSHSKVELLLDCPASKLANAFLIAHVGFFVEGSINGSLHVARRESREGWDDKKGH